MQYVMKYRTTRERSVDGGNSTFDDIRVEDHEFSADSDAEALESAKKYAGPRDELFSLRTVGPELMVPKSRKPRA